MDFGCALSTRPHEPCFHNEPVTRVRIEGSTVLFEAEGGLAYASNGAVAIDLLTGAIQTPTETEPSSDSMAVLCHEAIEQDGTHAACAHWSQNGSGAADLMICNESTADFVPCIAQVTATQQIGPDSNWGGEHPEGEAGNLLMSALETPRESIEDGNWSKGDTAFLGFRMRDEQGMMLYGWAEVELSDQGIILQRFAYDRSGQAIQAGTVAA